MDLFPGNVTISVVGLSDWRTSCEVVQSEQNQKGKKIVLFQASKGLILVDVKAGIYFIFYMGHVFVFSL